MLCTRRGGEDSISCRTHIFLSLVSLHCAAHMCSFNAHPLAPVFCTGDTDTSHPARILLNHLIRTPCQSLQGVPNLSSSCSTPPLTWTPAPETLTGIRPTTSATSPWGGHSDPLADPTPNTGYEPNLCIDVSSEHTPIKCPFRKNSFNLENFDGFPQQPAANAVVHLPALGNQREATILLQVLKSVC